MVRSAGRVVLDLNFFTFTGSDWVGPCQNAVYISENKRTIITILVVCAW